jgi:hypothetical protein
MKIINCNPEMDNSRSQDSLTDWLATLRMGRGTAPDQEAQETILGVFQRLMDHKFTLLQNLSLEGLQYPIPMVLVGPTGVWVILANALRGVFRARGDTWEKIDDRHQSYAPTGENLLTRASILGSTVESFLISHGFSHVPVEPVLVFTNPGIHVETIRPITRVVLVDALERFATGIVQGRIMYDSEQVQAIISLFSNPEESDTIPERATTLDKTSELINRGKAPVTERLDRIDNTFAKLDKMPFTSRQWIILGILILINIIILTGFVIYILIVT